MEAGSNATGSIASPVRQPRKLWRWFAGGFLLVFIGMLLLVTMTAMNPSGEFAVRSSLWRYYLVMVPRMFGTTTLGPASGGASGLVVTSLFHLLLSAGGGCAAASIGWWARRPQAPVGAKADAAPERRDT